MDWFNSILFAPYLLKNSAAFKLKIIGASALFIVLFHSTFQPFQFRLYSFNIKMEVLIAYTIITFALGSFNLFLIPNIFPKLFNEDYWTKTKEWLWLIWNLFSVGIGFFIFKVSFGFYPLIIDRVVTGILATLALGTIPITLYVVLGHAYILKQELENLKEINAQLILLQPQKSKGLQNVESHSHLITLKAQRGEFSISFQLNELLFIESVGNYISVTFFQNNILKIEKMRTTLTSVQKELSSYKEIIQTHRAFLVNTHHIKSIEGNSTAYKLAFHQSEIFVPISRSKIREVRNLLQLA